MKEQQVLELLAPLREPLDFDPASETQDSHELARRRTLSAMADVALRAAKPRWSPLWGVAVAAALLVALGSSWFSLSEQSQRAQLTAVAGRVLAENAGTSVLLEQGAPLEGLGGDLVTDQGSAELRLADGAELQLGAHSRVPLLDLTGTADARAVRLRSGSVRCKVPPRGEQRTFSVITDDARVEVRGTEFTVSVYDAVAGAFSNYESGQAVSRATHVAVHHGVVIVHHADGVKELKAGMTWRSPLRAFSDRVVQPAPERALPKASSSPSKEGPRTEARRSPDKVPAVPAAPLKSGTLDAERQLLHLGLSTERAGDPERAATHYRRLLRDFPESPLAPEARAGLVRLGVAAPKRLP